MKTYDLKPEMSAVEVTDDLVKAITSGDYDTIICNYANGDMVGHTGNFEASIKAVETVDACLSRIVSAIEEVRGHLLITADLLHGHLLSFNASCLRCGPLSVLKLSTNSALHVRLYSPGGGAATRVGAFDRSDLPAACAAHRRGGRLYALVSTGLASQQRSRGRVPSDPPAH